MKNTIKYIFKNYFEILAFSMGLVILALADPAAMNGPSLCLFDQLGIPFCPGDGLGHSIAYVFEGDIYKAMRANMIGPFAIIILVFRILYLLFENINGQKINR